MKAPTAHSASRSFIEYEVAEIAQHRLGPTENRSVIGIMNEFARLGRVHRRSNGVHDLGALSLRLAETPCGSLYGRHLSPDRELAAFVAQCPGR